MFRAILHWHLAIFLRWTMTAYIIYDRSVAVMKAKYGRGIRDEVMVCKVEWDWIDLSCGLASLCGI